MVSCLAFRGSTRQSPLVPGGRVHFGCSAQGRQITTVGDVSRRLWDGHRTSAGTGAFTHHVGVQRPAGERSESLGDLGRVRAPSPLVRPVARPWLPGRTSAHPWQSTPPVAEQVSTPVMGLGSLMDRQGEDGCGAGLAQQGPGQGRGPAGTPGVVHEQHHRTGGTAPVRRSAGSSAGRERPVRRPRAGPGPPRRAASTSSSRPARQGARPARRQAAAGSVRAPVRQGPGGRASPARQRVSTATAATRSHSGGSVSGAPSATSAATSGQAGSSAKRHRPAGREREPARDPPATAGHPAGPHLARLQHGVEAAQVVAGRRSRPRRRAPRPGRRAARRCTPSSARTVPASTGSSSARRRNPSGSRRRAAYARMRSASARARARTSRRTSRGRTPRARRSRPSRRRCARPRRRPRAP